MKTPDNSKKKGLPPELDSLLEDDSGEEIHRLGEVWDLAEDTQIPGFPDSARLDAIWSTIEVNIAEDDRQIAKEGRTPRRAADRLPKKNERSRRMSRVRWVALAVTVFVGLWGFDLWFSPVSVSAPLGEITTVSLGDGTSVELNSGSTLRYSRHFGKKRTVLLEGEAFFNVVKENRPFIVETFNASVQVLGTRFNVRAWEKDMHARTVVALQDGSVQLLERRTGSTPVQLVPGQTAYVEKSRTVLNEPDSALVASSIAWRSGEFFFSNERVESIFRDIERRFNTNIKLNPVSLGDKRIKYTHTNPTSAEVIIEELCTSIGLEYRPTQNGFEVFYPE